MLTNTFIHAPGIGRRTEASLWAQGFLTWDDYLAREGEARALSGAQRASLRRTVCDSLAALESRDGSYFARVLPASETWRVYPDFVHAAAFLDIETTGISSWDEITVIGIGNGEQVRAFIRGRNLEDFHNALDRVALLVTFSGSCFDLPFLRRSFPGVDLSRLMHVDLRFLLRRLGERGGLKEIERRFGIRRSPETEGLDGFDAVRLWREYRRGSAEALELLVRYNTEDIANLRPLMEYAYAAQRMRVLP